MSIPGQGRSGLDRVLHALGYSLQGLHAAIRNESAFRQETAAAVVLLPLALWVGRGWVEIALLTGAVALVLIVELMNTAVEAVVDRVSYEQHDLSKRAKDVGSAAVFLSILLCTGIWAAAIYHRFFA
ncbi:diacylglycerol kinase [Aquincola sp. S2]|uniref:Diacylglycerol kinase n=1 Tax=Pseudaquabacterium terrae TaxID=2732868 RepID=A0ABX2EJ81_9BURK|nr:diacylglycerol kinase [Aquabacterium terrae]NRF68650.1 diacylglycerol kinase [Aquabacterium terrae]